MGRADQQFAAFGFCKAHAAAFAVPTYRSAWLKRHYLPEFVAGLLTHDPGMYPRRLLLDDARQFGVAVLPLDVNRSGRDYRVERLPADEALRLLGVRRGRGRLPRGWRVRDGLLTPPRAWTWAGTPTTPRRGSRSGSPCRTSPAWTTGGRGRAGGAPVHRRRGPAPASALSAPVAEALAHAGALDVLCPARPTPRVGGADPARPAPGGQRALGGADPSPGGRGRGEPEQLGLLDPEPAPGLAEYRPSERVRAELEVLGLEASRHVITFYDDLLDVLGVTRTVDLLAAAPASGCGWRG